MPTSYREQAVYQVLAAGCVITIFTTMWFYYYAPKQQAAYSRLECTCIIGNLTIYGDTCQVAQQTCFEINGKFLCDTVDITVPCGRVTILWEFNINDTVKTDTRDVKYNGQKINQTSTCYYDGALSFDSAYIVLMGPRAAIGVVGTYIFIMYIACVTIIGGRIPDDVNRSRSKKVVQFDIKPMELKTIPASVTEVVIQV